MSADYSALFRHVDAIFCRLEAETMSASNNQASYVLIYEAQSLLEQFSHDLLAHYNPTQAENTTDRVGMAAATLAAGLRHCTALIHFPEFNDVLNHLELAAKDGGVFADYLSAEKRNLIPLLMSMLREAAP